MNNKELGYVYRLTNSSFREDWVKIFNPIEFDGFRNQSGLNSFSLTPKEWADKTGSRNI